MTEVYSARLRAIADRAGTSMGLTLPHGVYAALLGSLPFMSDPIALGLWSVAIGMAGGVVAGLPTALVGDLVAPAQHGVAVGWLRTMTDAGHILGPAAMGALGNLRRD